MKVKALPAAEYYVALERPRLSGLRATWFLLPSTFCHCWGTPVIYRSKQPLDDDNR
ncbi:MAG: hypothetical protein ACJ707_06485 [Nitrososphaera sp.]